MRFTTAIVLGQFLAVALELFGRSAHAQESDLPKLASVVSRDSMLFLWIDDRASFVRRAEHTRIYEALAEYDDDALPKVFTKVASDASIFLSPTVLQLARFVCVHGHGEVALSVEGMQSDHDKLVPELLAIAAKPGLEDVLKLLDRCAAGETDAADDLEDLEVPIDLDGMKVTKAKADDGGAYLSISLGDRGQVVIAENGDQVLIASQIDTLKRALERRRNPSFGSLRDSLRFRELWRDLSPGRGSLVAYANLRRIRQDGGLTPTLANWASGLFNGKLSGFDGIALAVRGVGEQFAAQIELERGRTSGDEPLLRDNDVFTYASRLPDSRLVAALRLDAAEIAEWLKGMLFLGGNTKAWDRIADFVEECGGQRAFEPLGRAIGGEFECFVIGADDVVDQLPRLGARIQVRDRKLLEHVLAELAKVAPNRIKKSSLNGETVYTLAISGSMFATDPSFLVRDDEIIAATSGVQLRDVLDAMKRNGSFEHSKRFLSGFDALDVDPMGKSVGHLFIDSASLASAVEVWLPTFHSLSGKATWTNEMQSVVFHLLGDPDIQEALRMVVARGESRPSGARIELIGP